MKFPDNLLMTPAAINLLIALELKKKYKHEKLYKLLDARYEPL